jgi:hypothetical protein
MAVREAQDSIDGGAAVNDRADNDLGRSDLDGRCPSD